MTITCPIIRPAALAALATFASGGILHQRVQAQVASPPACVVSGRITSGNVTLPGVSVLVFVNGERQGQTTTGSDGTFTLKLAPDGHYRISAELSFFQSASRDVATTAAPCDQAVNVALVLQPRQAPAAVRAAGPRAGAPGQANPRFETLNVRSDASAAILDTASVANDSDLLRLLPPGFSAEMAASDAVAINGSGDAATVDRRGMTDRLDAIGRGEFDPATGQFAAGFGPGGGPGGGFGPGGPGGFGGGPGGPGGPGGFGPGGPGPGGPGVFVLGGRGGRTQDGYRGTANYSFGGSLLDSAPYQLRPEVPVTQPQFAKNTFGATIGGPFKIPGLYENTNRRSNFQLNFNANRSNNVFNQYATVPSDAMRAGDFSGSVLALIDPRTGQPFPGNQIPSSQMNSGALALLSYIPRANLPGTSQNYQMTALAHSSSDDLSLRFTQNLSPTVARAGAGGPGAGAAGRMGGGAQMGPGGGRGAAARGTTVMLNGQLQIRHSDNDAPNVFASLASRSSSTNVTVPLSLNIVRGRTMQNINVNLAHAASSSTNDFSDVTDVAGASGIVYPGATALDALNWGIPNLSFATFSSARLQAATARTDDRLSLGYSLSRSVGLHQVRVGGDYRFDRSASQNNSNARGSFLFTGAYTAPNAEVAGGSGADFADFLLGLPQQATLQSGGTTELRGQSFSAYVEDNWRRSGRLTFNLGLRYELVLPYTEVDGRMANLDVTPDFTAASAVTAGGTAPFTGAFPAGLVDADVNNIGPRLGVAYRLAAGTVLRGGYSVTYNNNSYAAIARQLSSQPPFAFTQTVIGSVVAPLALQSALLSSTSGTTNNWGVERDYALGKIQTWNAALSRDVSKNWSLFFGYTGTRGSNLDILRAPNRDPDGLRIPGVQAFIWESSEGRSLLNSGTVQVRRRLAGGVSASSSYTLAKSMDNASSLGAGATVVAQNDQDLDAEWARSNFDRRHQFSAQASWELPFGTARRWLQNGGFLAAAFGSWNLSANFSYQSGTPFTARIVGAASDAARGTSGSLRANYDGSAIAIGDPSISQFFNTAAFTVPAAGTFGNSARNIIVGPASHQLNASLSRDVRVGTNRSVTVSLNASNLLNSVQWSAIDTNLNSATFGQVLSVRPLRTMTANLRVRF